MSVWDYNTLVRTNPARGADSPYYDLIGDVVGINTEDEWIFVDLWTDRIGGKPTGFKPDELVVLMEPVSVEFNENVVRALRRFMRDDES